MSGSDTEDTISPTYLLEHLLSYHIWMDRYAVYRSYWPAGGRKVASSERNVERMGTSVKCGSTDSLLRAVLFMLDNSRPKAELDTIDKVGTCFELYLVDQGI